MQTKLIAGSALFLLTVAVSACGSESTPAPTTTTTQPPSSVQSTPPAGTPGVTAPSPTTSVPMMPNPNGDGSMVPCEGTICTNPNHGAGPDGDAPPEPGQTEMQGPDGDAPPEPGQTEMEGP